MLRSDTKRTQRAAVARGTRANLQSQWKTYYLFCTYFELEPLPASVDLLCCYVEFLKRSLTSINSIKNYINGVKLLHMFHDLPFVSNDNLLYRLTIRGAAKSLFREPKRATPVTPPILLELWRATDFADHVACTVFCVCVFAFFTLARKSSLLPASSSSFDKKLYPCRNDVKLTDFGLLFTIKYSKCNQFGDRHRTVPLLACPDSPICPRLAFVTMCKLIPAPPSDPLFVIPPSPSNKQRLGRASLSGSQFDLQLHRLFSRAGFAGCGFTAHSFRRGI